MLLQRPLPPSLDTFHSDTFVHWGLCRERSPWDEHWSNTLTKEYMSFLMMSDRCVLNFFQGRRFHWINALLHSDDLFKCTYTQLWEVKKMRIKQISIRFVRWLARMSFLWAPRVHKGKDFKIISFLTNHLLKIYRYTIYTLFKCLSLTSNTLCVWGFVEEWKWWRMWSRWAVILEKVGRWEWAVLCLH